jgi:hypothetical protein
VDRFTSLNVNLLYRSRFDIRFHGRGRRRARRRTNVEPACLLEADAQEAKTFVYAGLDPEPAVAAVAGGGPHLHRADEPAHRRIGRRIRMVAGRPPGEPGCSP